MKKIRIVVREVIHLMILAPHYNVLSDLLLSTGNTLIDDNSPGKIEISYCVPHTVRDTSPVMKVICMTDYLPAEPVHYFWGELVARKMKEFILSAGLLSIFPRKKVIIVVSAGGYRSRSFL